MMNVCFACLKLYFISIYIKSKYGTFNVGIGNIVIDHTIKFSELLALLLFFMNVFNNACRSVTCH